MARDDNGKDMSNKSKVKSVSTVFSIIERLKESDGMGVSELARNEDMSKGAIHRYLNTLVDEGYAIKRDEQYALSMQFLDFGAYVRDRYPFTDYIEPKVEQLAEVSGERAQYIVEEHGRGVYLYRKRGQNAVETNARVGKRVFLHTTAAGKAVLSELSDEHVEEIIEQYGLSRKTKNTITDRADLFDQLETVRERGYALNEEEHVPGLYAVGVPITTREGDVRGGLSVSGPANRLKDQVDNGTLQKTLLGVEDEIELNLNYS